MKGCDTSSIFLLTMVNNKQQLTVALTRSVCQTIMTERIMIIYTVFKLVLILNFSLSVYKCSYFLANGLYTPCLAIKMYF